ncbi:hypothetical protein HID58_007092 [Brassica napus]|uniref:Uncharacterized protein n=1 Tax=Brassica napus TaxID=3708 RepID=A0ABQ8ED82_BRANA|nr:hypothetical protein HID58_007092 [Brassica napus]
MYIYIFSFSNNHAIAVRPYSRCFLHSSPSFDLESSPFILGILVPCCMVVSYGVVLAKVRNYILLGLSQSLVVIDVVFLVASLPSIVFARLSFQDLIFGDLTSMLFFIARGWLHGASYLLDGGCASGALDMRLFVSVVTLFFR